MADFEPYRRDDYTIDLVKAYKDLRGEGCTAAGVQFLRQVEKYHRIKSRQVAASTLAQAEYIIPSIVWRAPE